jgi:hypothetical protein
VQVGAIAQIGVKQHQPGSVLPFAPRPPPDHAVGKENIRIAYGGAAVVWGTQQRDRLLRGDQTGEDLGVTSPFADVPAKAAAKDNLARAQRLRALAVEATTPNLRGRLLAAAEECEWLAGRKEPEPMFDPALLKVRRERPWPGVPTE